MSELFDQDLGLDLLMNPRKKGSSDALSVISSNSRDRDADVRSVKSVSIEPEIVDIKQRIKAESSEGSSYDDGDDESEYSSESALQFQRRKPRDNRSRSNYSSSQSDDASEESFKQHKRGASEEDILNSKREMLYQFDRLEKKGWKLPRKFTMASSLEEMKAEYERLKRDKEVDTSIKFQRKTVITVASGIELLNGMFNPVGAKLDGWSENLNENIEDYDDIFEELHDKYKGKAKIAPEVKLLMMLGGSAFMFHMTNSMFKTAPGLEEVLRQNPELKRQFAEATAKTMANNTSNQFSGLGGMFSSMFSGGGLGNLFGGGNKSVPSYETMPQMPIKPPAMKGPSNVDDILRDLELGDPTENDRVEMMSTVTASELTEMADDASINGLLMNKMKKKGRSKITLDI